MDLLGPKRLDFQSDDRFGADNQHDIHSQGPKPGKNVRGCSFHDVELDTRVAGQKRAEQLASHSSSYRRDNAYAKLPFRARTTQHCGADQSVRVAQDCPSHIEHSSSCLRWLSAFILPLEQTDADRVFQCPNLATEYRRADAERFGCFTETPVVEHQQRVSQGNEVEHSIHRLRKHCRCALIVSRLPLTSICFARGTT